MNYITPEMAGILSQDIINFIEKLEDARLSTHNIILSKGNEIFFEHYWKPFDKNFLHRQYSVSKSIVSIAIGFCEQEGLLALDDKISKYFQKECENQPDENMKNQTIRDMLMMATAKQDRYWFSDKPKDRVEFYFENDLTSRPSGTIFDYDSSGSFVLSALVERLTGKLFMEYLREKLFDKIGVSKEAYCLKCPGGHSWGDSGVLCTAQDMLKIARFVMNKGKWNGEQILNEKYIIDATSQQIDNNILGSNEFDTQGYGYQIWMTKRNGFFFNGMGCQFAVCIPDKDLIMIYNADNQGKALAKKIIFDAFYENIVEKIEDRPLKQSDGNVLKGYTEKLNLASAIGKKYTDFEKEINGATFIVKKENSLGITKFTLDFNGEKGVFSYTNEQGDKKIPFGMCKNEFSYFPQEGYSDEVGTEKTTNFYYKCAASAAWIEDRKLFIKVQIIDKYFGNLNITIGFNGNKAGILMCKYAEDFLDEYEGILEGVRQ